MFLSHLCGGKYILSPDIPPQIFLSHLCGGKFTNPSLRV
ncbi:hypothetical protein [uncultured Gammaproteobacteria bacterium]|nr:hypothetical protein [uncultured Gammaproteobacteria bacterium]